MDEEWVKMDIAIERHQVWQSMCNNINFKPKFDHDADETEKKKKIAGGGCSDVNSLYNGASIVSIGLMN